MSIIATLLPVLLRNTERLARIEALPEPAFIELKI
jgi:hypothetical protein